MDEFEVFLNETAFQARTAPPPGLPCERHEGKPEKYPCLGISSFWDDPNGPYTYTWYFLYPDSDAFRALQKASKDATA